MYTKTISLIAVTTNSRRMLVNKCYLAIALIFSFVGSTAQISRTYLNDSLIYTEGELEGELQTGEWRFYNAKTDDLLQIGYYETGRKEGIWVAYFPNGQLHGQSLQGAQKRPALRHRGSKRHP